MRDDDSTPSLGEILERLYVLSPNVNGPVNPIISPPFTHGEMKIIEVPVRLVSKIQISRNSEHYCSDEFRDRMNAWLIKRFGTRDVTPIKPGEAITMGNVAFLRPEGVVMLNNIT